MPIARHQENNGNGVSVCFNEENIELLTGPEALPPGANPFVADKRVVGVGLADQFVPHGLQIEKRLIVCNGFDSPYRFGAPARYGRRNNAVRHRFSHARIGDKFDAGVMTQSDRI